ncbi:MAG: DUF922 domain-containing protein [Brevundimonas sp.]|uniref:DUF922 domain-containing protein n=1 Tax=Brevundimonas sp. TaxID=1871086 RepID=UPI002ABD08AB|nr:DUF922 domain-containing protein [Brevundimonas sp.]MDZ4112057.1 DUF922 domain-containing protein [Brevundimonas sp.]
MFNRRLLVPVFAALVTALAASPSFAQTHHESDEGILARWVPLDLVLGTSAEGRRESETFSIDGQTYRLFVRDTGVTTARGPHDRVCTEWVAGGNRQNIKHLAISLTSAGPDGRRPVHYNNGSRNAEIICDLLPPADAYRVWSVAPRRTTVTPQWERWQAPAAVASFERMLEQDDSDQAMSRNIARLIGSQELDGVCLEISVIRAPFSSPEGILAWPVWFEAFQAIRDRMYQTLGLKGRHPSPNDAGYVQRERGIVRTYFGDSDSGGPQRYLSFDDLPTRDGYALLHTLGFMTKEDIEIYLTERPLDPEQLPIQSVSRDCFGDPIVFYRGSSQGTVELYAFARISVVLPYWIEYSEADADARRHWQAFNDHLLRHELVHVYDHIALVDEAVFRARGEVDLLVSLRTNRPPGVWAIDYQAPYGLWGNQGRFLASDFFARYLDDLWRGSLAASGYSHNALYGVDSNGQRTADLDIDLLTPIVRDYGDEAARRRAASAIIQKWVEPGGAAN